MKGIAEMMGGGGAPKSSGTFGKASLGRAKMPPPMPTQPEPEEEPENSALEQVRQHLQASLDMLDELLGGGDEADYESEVPIA